MIRVTLIVLIDLFLFNSLSYGQIDSLQKVIVVEAIGNGIAFPERQTIFDIDRKMRYTQDGDSLPILVGDLQLIEALVSEIISCPKDRVFASRFFEGMDLDQIETDVIQLSISQGDKKSVVECLQENLSDHRKVQSVLMQCVGQYNRSLFQLIEVSFFFQQTSIVVRTESHYPYFMPWVINNQYKLYCTSISTNLADLLKSNTYFENYLRNSSQSDTSNIASHVRRFMLQLYCE